MQGRGLYFLSVCALRECYFGKRTLLPFTKVEVEEERGEHSDMHNKLSNLIILEFERNLNLAWLSKYAFEQVFNNLTQENGNCYTSCHFGPSQQHCICCIP